NGGMGGAKGASGDGTGSGGKGSGGKGMGGAGMGGAAGAVSLACSQPKYSHTSGFGAILDGWVVAANSTPPSLAPTLDADGGTISGTKVEIDKTDGSPGTTPVGSVKLTIPFDQPNEMMLFAQNMNSINLMG